MATDSNVAIVHRVVEEVFNQGNMTVANELLSPERSAALVGTATRLRAAFPDLRMSIEDTLAMDDKVVIRATVRCTHTGAPFWGVPATGKRATWEGIDMSRIAGGKIVELWAHYDYLGLLEQLGIIAPHEEGQS